MEAEHERPIRLIYKPSDTELRITKTMINHLTRDDLQKKAVPIFRLMQKFRLRYNDGADKPILPKAIAAFEETKNQAKDMWLELFAIFYNEQNIGMLLEDASQREMNLWYEVLRNHFLIDTEVNKIMDKNCFEADSWYYNSCELCDQLSPYFDVARIKYGFSREDCFIYIESILHQLLLKKFFPDLINIKGLKELPKDSSLKVYNVEQLVFLKLPILASLYDSGVMPRGFAKLTGAMVKKIQKILTMPDFFQTYPDAKQASISAALMANNYLFFRAGMGNKALPESPERLLKDVIREAFRGNAFTLPVSLPYIKGIKKSSLDTGNIHFVMTMILSLLKTRHKKGWLPVDALIMKIRTYDLAAENRFLLLRAYNLTDIELSNGYVDDANIHLGLLAKQIGEPFVKSLLFTLATFGIVEIAYREPATGDTSYYDGLQYVRLTELGEYVLDLNLTYTPKRIYDNTANFELDEQRLLIRVLRADSPFVSMLDDFAKRITPSLYRVDYESFLKGCLHIDNVKQKIKMFTQYISHEHPAVWKQFFKEVQERVNPFSTPSSQYFIMCIEPDNHELQRLILTEPSIRKYVLKAENYMLLVKTTEKEQFANALRKFGYLL